MNSTNSSASKRGRSKSKVVVEDTEPVVSNDQIVPEVVSGPPSYTVPQRIGFLRRLHRDNGTAILAWEAAMLRNVLDMSEHEKAGIPVNEIRAAVVNLKTAQNSLSRLLAQAGEAANMNVG